PSARRPHLIRGRKMRHLIRMSLHEGWARRGARDIAATSGIARQPVEPIDEAQHVRHEDVSDGEAAGEPFATGQDRLHMLKPVDLEESVEKLPGGRIVTLPRE